MSVPTALPASNIAVFAIRRRVARDARLSFAARGLFDVLLWAIEDGVDLSRPGQPGEAIAKRTPDGVSPAEWWPLFEELADYGYVTELIAALS